MGEFGAWRKGSELWGQLHREQRRWGKGYGGRETEGERKGCGHFLSFENLRGEEQRQRGGEEVSGEKRRETKRRGGKRREEVRRGELRRGGER